LRKTLFNSGDCSWINKDSKIRSLVVSFALPRILGLIIAVENDVSKCVETFYYPISTIFGFHLSAIYECYLFFPT